MLQSMGSQRVRQDLATEQMSGGGCHKGGRVQIQERGDGLLHQADMKRNEVWFPQSQRLPQAFSGNLRLGLWLKKKWNMSDTSIQILG